MFRRPNLEVTVQAPEAQHHHHTASIHEHRAPTDESIKLYKEMEEKAQAAIIKSVRITSNDFKTQIHVCQDAANDLTIARAIFDLNGKRFQVEADIGRVTENKPILMEKLRDAIALRIAQHIMESFPRS